MKGDFYSSLPMFIIGFMALAISFFIAMFTLLQHLLHYTAHRLQRYTVRILIFLPIYGVLTYTLLIFPRLFDLLSMLRNAWEGFLIHSFLFLMLEYCGGESACGEAISKHPSIIQHLWPLRLISVFGLNEDIPLNVGFVKRSKMCTIQYAIMRLIFSMLLIGVHISGYKWSGFFSISSTVILSVSLYVALYSLGLFYLAIRDHPALSRAHSLTKFFSLKLCFALSFYQGLILDLFLLGLTDRSIRIKSFVLLLETVAFALVQHRAYRITEFYPITYSKESGRMTRLEKFNRYLSFCLDDLKAMKTTQGMSTIITNAGNALNLSDFFKDTYYNISEKYKEHSIFVSENIVNSDIVVDGAPGGDLEMNHMDSSLSTSATPVASESAKKAGSEENFADFKKVNDSINNDQRCNEISKLQFI
ncbi:uncharacterized protein TOT_020000480 [Theileria orientalis strain Shintoku]|uniref:Organic solute transporter n=1 Tax=Theileria orientalis strain Shintoku TaxID=869250 RepID=J4DP75_THEOR|nr:uncharacterized protein TOT_020000480 [Theileria orientalis strain Shintoku]PVC51645.1 hypothetical protein MACL_00001467 [Theileria orientalis]BAM40219.1 uncharacterized protein TOT_020000480 [Theileria orientalis strain Shintoku]|eukprot:XP_009690520.1 uncharacterized protein TOT_020000480 [Theileria orientalis strain Shintoku]